MERLQILQWTLEIGVQVGSYRLTKSGVIWTELRPVSGIAIFDSSVAMMQEILWKIGDGANYSLVLPDAIKNEGANYSLVLRDPIAERLGQLLLGRQSALTQHS